MPYRDPLPQVITGTQNVIQAVLIGLHALSEASHLAVTPALSRSRYDLLLA